jgi:hypothetical protein
MMSFPALVAWTLGLVATAWTLMRRRKWLAVVPLPFAVLFASGAFDAARDPHIGPAIIHELGYTYVALGFVPLTEILVLVFILKKKPANKAVDPTPWDAARISRSHSKD